MKRAPTREKINAILRQGALSRAEFGKPRGTRAQAAVARVPVPGHYYAGTTAAFIVPDEPFCLGTYLHAMTSGDEEFRGAAVDVVGEFGDASCVGVLVDVLHCAPGVAEEGTWCHAANALASIGGPEAEDSLWRALENKSYSKHLREIALAAVLDMLTPDGWDNYNFMCSTRARLSARDRDRLLLVRDDLPLVVDILRKFDSEDEEQVGHEA